MNTSKGAPPPAYAGLFMVTLATLMYQILLTRIFSVTLFYHFAFMAISLAMFGMTVGALIVYLRPKLFAQERAHEQLTQYALYFAVATAGSFLLYLGIPPMFGGATTAAALTLTYILFAVPFVCSGVCVCLALTRFPTHVSRLYAADLIGAALGCILLLVTLNTTDGPTAVVVTACFAAVGALFFARSDPERRRVVAASRLTVVFAVVAVGHTVLVWQQRPVVRLQWIKDYWEGPALFERWNSFSRIRVDKDPGPEPFGWGMSALLDPNRPVDELFLNVDGLAGSPLTRYSGQSEEIEHLRYDVTNMAHYLRPHADVLAVGAGGGRDVLSALAFRQKSVVGVEINGTILQAVNGHFGDFTGQLPTRPGVRFVNDEARSYIARTSDRFDILQISMIDTWAATAAGAFVLTENSLYTREAWRLFLSRLKPNGVLTVSRWYFRDQPAEVYRLVALANAALRDLGVKDPRPHIAMVRRLPDIVIPGGLDGVGTILVSRDPFSAADLEMLEQTARRLRFEVVLSTRHAADGTFAELASSRDLERVTSNYPLNIAPPTDDSPYYFQMLRVRDVFSEERHQHGTMQFNARAVSTLVNVVLIIFALTLLCIILPLGLTRRCDSLKGSLPLFVFFSSIGLGYVLIEISQMQRLSTFLGHPTYGLSVILFALLLSSGLGSYFTSRVAPEHLGAVGARRLLLLLVVLLVFGFLTPVGITLFSASVTPVRILVAVGTLFPMGLFMGMAFPIGMKLAAAHASELTPWLWGVNGATSVCASALAIVISLAFNISAAFWAGFVCYLVALIALRAFRQQESKTALEVEAVGQPV